MPLFPQSLLIYLQRLKYLWHATLILAHLSKTSAFGSKPPLVNYFPPSSWPPGVLEPRGQDMSVVIQDRAQCFPSLADWGALATIITCWDHTLCSGDSLGNLKRLMPYKNNQHFSTTRTVSRMSIFGCAGARNRTRIIEHSHLCAK